MTSESKEKAAETAGLVLTDDINMEAEGASRFRQLEGVPKYVKLTRSLSDERKDFWPSVSNSISKTI